ncbi:hypothetical protein SeLEV6574_g00435 [Synchytrium endobioticum]|uniref:DUF4042 domain-containing protein n=1 Tax=Synchytrium endobioticum TaxID=286115 RepID=A0A507DJW5_9FUNG|nr:hypothetical protein SeLEV6574_g00435 [Synchytrium endobioticum]
MHDASSTSPVSVCFHALVDELCAKTSAASQSQRTDLDILDDLTHLQYPVNGYDFKTTDVAKLSKWCGKYRTKPQSLKFCQVLFKLYSRQKAPILTESQVVISFILFLMDVLKKSGNTTDLEKVHVLKALGTVLFENGPSLQENYLQQQVVEMLLSVIHQYSDLNTTASSSAPQPPSMRIISGNSSINSTLSASAEIRRAALVCLGHLCVKIGPKAPFYSEICQAIYVNLRECRKIDGGNNSAKVATSALRALQFVLTENKAAVASAVEPLVSLICMIAIETELASSSGASNLQLGGSAAIITCSDSEMSDNDFHVSNRPSKNLNRLEMNALQCMHTAVKSNPKLFHSSWSRILPDGPPTAVNQNTGHIYNKKTSIRQPSIFSIASSHPQSRVRLAAYQVIGALFDGAKQYLAIADALSSTKSFTSLAERLGRQLMGSYIALLSAVPEESDTMVLVHLLKTVAELIRNTTFKNLPSDLPLWILSLMNSRIRDGSDASIQIVSLEVVSSLVDSGFKLSAMEALQKQNSGYSLLSILELMDFEGDSVLGVKIAAYECLGAVCRSDILSLNLYWDDVISRVDKAVKDEKQTLRAASFKLLEQYLQAGNANNNIDTAADDPEADAATNHTWLNAVERIGIVTIVLGMMSSSGEKGDSNDINGTSIGVSSDQGGDANVRMAACRTAGVFVGFPVLQEDALFLMDIAMILKPNISDKTSVGVRSRASWALANLTDALVAKMSNTPEVSEVFNDALLIDLMDTALLAARDNDKCRSSGVRALGNLMRISNASLLSRECERKVKEVVTALTKNICSGAMKTRWNACHAVGTMLGNWTLPCESASWTKSLMEALVQTVSSCKNFKVRINAAAALSIPLTISKYGGNEVVSRICEVLDDAYQHVHVGVETSVTFGEYKYREQLVNQIRMTFQHMHEIINKEEHDVKSVFNIGMLRSHAALPEPR